MTTLAVAAGLLAASAGTTAAATSIATGPSSATDPYVLPVADGVAITSLLTVGDAGAAGNGYELVGNSDGLGVTSEDGKVVLYLNHELRRAQGIVRRHGQRGAFNARFEVDQASLAVLAGSDTVDPGVVYWDYPSGTYVTGPSAPRFANGAAQDLRFIRWCSGTLSDPGLYWSESKQVGYTGQLWVGNEEEGDNGRAFGVTTDGFTQGLPRFGLFSWENAVPAPNKSETTLVTGLEDGPADGSQVSIYAGEKLASGNPFELAGLTNGSRFVIDAVDEAVTDDAEWRSTYGTGVAAPVMLREVAWDQTGAAQNAQAIADGLSLNRIEDGSWDPQRADDFYFVTTEGGDTATTFPNARDGGGLWRLRFQNIEKPTKGATLTLVLDGTESLGADEPKLNKPDNITIDGHGNLLIQEDAGNNAHLGRIVAYRIKDGAMGVVARFDETLFGSGAPGLITVNEESSGIIDAERVMGPGGFFFTAMAHTNVGLPAGTGPGTVEELVERGQLLFMRVTDWAAVYGD
jgi:hypothetical protein